jgi:hypothetical protein
MKKRQPKGPDLSNIDIPAGPKTIDGDPPPGPSRVDHPGQTAGHMHPYHPGPIHTLPHPQDIPHTHGPHHAVHGQQIDPPIHHISGYPGEHSVIGHLVTHQHYPHAHEQAMAHYPTQPHMYPSLERGASFRQSQLGHRPDCSNYNVGESKSLDRKGKTSQIEMHPRPQSTEAIYSTYDGRENLRY